MAENIVLKKRPYALIIRDGWGWNPDKGEDAYNAAKVGKTPTDDMLMREYPHTLVHTYGGYVGLPDGTMGNSGVGHQNIVAGRIVPQESVRLSKTIQDGSFFENPEFLRMIESIKAGGGKMHVMGLCSDIGVHSLLSHLYGLLELAQRSDLEEVYFSMTPVWSMD